MLLVALILSALAFSSFSWASFAPAPRDSVATPAAGSPTASVGLAPHSTVGPSAPGRAPSPSAPAVYARSLLGASHLAGPSASVSATALASKSVTGPMGISGRSVGRLVTPLSAAAVRSTPILSGGPGWEGINSTTSECGCAPPDVILAAGPTDIVEMNNLELQVWTTSGTFVTNASLWTFWASEIPATASISDPRILYDNLTGLWYASLFDISTNSVLLGGSTSSNPVGSWVEYSFPAYPNEFPDQPYIGVSEWMIGISSNDFNLTTSGLDGTGMILVNRTDFLGGVTYYYSSNPQNWIPNVRAESSLTLSPVQTYGGINTGGPAVVFLNWTHAPPAAPSYFTSGALIAAIATPPAAPQPGTTDLIDTSDGRTLSTFISNGLQTLTFTDAGGGCSYSCVRIEQLWTTNVTLRQDTEIYGGGIYLFYPAVAADSRGDLSMVVGYSSSTSYPSDLYLGQAWNEPHTLALGSISAVAGSAAITVACNTSSVCRYGDYFGAAVDPRSSFVWTGSEFEKPGVYWTTWIRSVETNPISVSAAASAATIDVGQSVTFTATATGGEGTYHYNWTRLPAGCVNSRQSTVTCTPSVTGSLTVGVNASDSFPRNSSATAAFSVDTDPTLGALSASKPTADVGQTVTFTSATPAGGTPAFTYSWAGLPGGCGSPTTNAVVCTFTTSGTFSLNVTATDATSGAATSPAFSYTVSPALVVGTPTTTPASADTGTTFTFTISPTGGSGGDQYTWSGLPTGCLTANAASITCIPSAAGKFNVTVTVSDSNGAAVTSAKALVTVTTPSTSGLFGLPGSTGWILVALIVVVLAVLIAVLLMRRRRKPAPGPTAWPPSTTGGTGGPPAGAMGGPPPGAGGPPPPT